MVRTAMRRMAAAAAIVLSVIPVTALAHGRLRSSVPAANARVAQVPAELRLTFSEPAELAFTTVRVFSADGVEVTMGPVRFADDGRRIVIAPVTGAMQAGRHTVRWQVAGADGHPVRGEYVFTVTAGTAAGAGEAAPPAATPVPAAADTAAAATDPMAGMHHDPVAMPDRGGFGVDSPLYVVVRWLNFVALLLAIGAASFHWLVLVPVRGASDEASVPAWADVDRRAARLGLGAAVALGVALAARLLAQSYAMHGADGTLGVTAMGAMIGTTTWGYGWALQFAAVGLTVAGYRAAGASMAPRASRIGWIVATLGAIAGAFAPALSGHAASAPRLRVLAMLSDGLHVLAASSWLGTLAVLLVAGVGASWAMAPERRGALVRGLVNRFSPVALACAGVAALTGTFAAWLHVGGVTQLWTSRYGVTLLVKLGVLALVALTGYYNWRRVQPRLGTDDATTALQRSARVEVGIAVLVLLVTAVLVATPPAMEP